MNAVSQSIVLPLMLHKHALSVIEADYQSRQVHLSRRIKQTASYYYTTTTVLLHCTDCGAVGGYRLEGKLLNIVNCEVIYNSISNITLYGLVILLHGPGCWRQSEALSA